MSQRDVVDLRSDTVTRPSAAMREAMAQAEVGDDVYGEDPTARRLEERAAALVGHQAGLFVPTGSMGNQIAIHLHTRPGSDVIVEEGTHVYRYELGTMSAWSGALPRVLRGASGLLAPEQVAEAIAPDIYYMAPTAALVLENSHNHAGGVVIPLQRQAELIAVAREHGVLVHLDGARIFNAATALGVEPRRLAGDVDTVMFCFSKGLGAPVGSMLCGQQGADPPGLAWCASGWAVECARWAFSPRRGCTPSNTTSTGWPTITSARHGWPARWTVPRCSRSTRPACRPTS